MSATIELEKLAKRKQRLREDEKKIRLQEQKIKDRAKKSETQKIFRIGEMAKKAEINNLDDDVIFGAFLDIKKRAEDPNTLEQWKRETEEFERTFSKSRILVSFHEEPPAKAKQFLKSQNFRWNSFREEWQGLGQGDYVKEQLDGTGAAIEIL